MLYRHVVASSYFDHNATAPLLPAVRDAMQNWLARTGGDANPSSLHQPGQAARATVEEARERVAALLGARPDDLVFTSSGTEAANLAVLGGALGLEAAGRPCAIVSSPLEHPCVLRAAEAGPHPPILVAPEASGYVDPERVSAAFAQHPEAGLLSVAAVNHELGTVADLVALSQAAKAERDAVVHTDAVQALGKIGLDLSTLPVDLVSINAHKIGGPRGVGALWIRPGTPLSARILGGRQERGRRAGTEADLLIHGFGVAAAAVREAPRVDDAVRKNTARLRAGLLAIPGCQVHGDPTGGVGNTLCATFDDCDGQTLMMALDLDGFAVSTGAACSSGTVEPSQVLLALGLSPVQARSALRFSLGPDNDAADVDALLVALGAAIARVRRTVADQGAA